jgi:hypothetical protein
VYVVDRLRNEYAADAFERRLGFKEFNKNGDAEILVDGSVTDLILVPLNTKVEDMSKCTFGE